MTAPLQLLIENEPADPLTIDEVLRRGVATLMPEIGLRELLSEGPIRLYLGIDPTSPDLHIGHMVPLRKLRQFQDLGHHVILLIGTFTGKIGDPTDKTAARVQLTDDQIAKNVATYREQAGKILDLSPRAPNPVTIVYNHEWLNELTVQDLIRLSALFTVNQLIARDTYRKRLADNKPLYLHELLYPIFQGYDSFALDVQLEIGGRDQIPNMVAGMDLMKAMAAKQKHVMGLKLVESPDGSKMGKTSGQVVNLLEWPEVIYEALMQWPDQAIALGLELLTSLPMKTVEAVSNELRLIASDQSEVHPMVLKAAFAHRVISELNGEDEANFARRVFNDVKKLGQLPPRIKTTNVDGEIRVVDALVLCGLAPTTDNGQSMVTQGQVLLNGVRVVKNTVLKHGTYKLSLGKNSIGRIREIVVSKGECK